MGESSFRRKHHGQTSRCPLHTLHQSPAFQRSLTPCFCFTWDVLPFPNLSARKLLFIGHRLNIKIPNCFQSISDNPPLPPTTRAPAPHTLTSKQIPTKAGSPQRKNEHQGNDPTWDVATLGIRSLLPPQTNSMVFIRVLNYLSELQSSCLQNGGDATSLLNCVRIN